MLTNEQLLMINSKDLDKQSKVYIEKETEFRNLGFNSRLVLNVMNRALSCGHDLKDFITPEFSEEQANEVSRGLRMGLSQADVRTYANTQYCPNQMFWIRHGFMARKCDDISAPVKSFDVSIYAKPEIDASYMRDIYMWLVLNKDSEIKDWKMIISLVKLGA